MSQRVVYINGRFVPENEAGISIFDSANMFGDLVFEMTRSFNRQQFKLREHLERLNRSIKTLRIPLEMTVEQLEYLVQDVISRNQPFMDEDEEDRVMIDVSRGILSTYHPFSAAIPARRWSFPVFRSPSRWARSRGFTTKGCTPSRRCSGRSPRT